MHILEIPAKISINFTSPYDLGLIACDIMKQFSQDPKKQLGAAIIDNSYNIYGLGSNAYPYKKIITKEDKELLNSNNFNNEHRYRLEHAERNAIFFAIRNSNPLKNNTLVVNYTPCVDCANSIVNSQLCAVVDSSIPNFDHHRWGSGWKYVVEDLFKRSGVQYINHRVDPKVKDKVIFPLEKLIREYYKNNIK